MLEPASDRFHKLVYQRQMAANESQEKAWAYCQQSHKETFAAYQQETAASAASATAANDREVARKETRTKERHSRQLGVQAAVDDYLRKHPGSDYTVAFNAVQRAQPKLFVTMETPASNPDAAHAELASNDRNQNGFRVRG